MKILVVGAGSTGGYFGGRLAEAGRDVTFLVRSARAESIRKDGLQIVSPFGDFTLQPKLISANKIASPYEVILLSVKAYGLETAMDDFAAAVGPDTMIFPLLNGMRHLNVLASRFGEKAVLGGICRISSEVDEAGRIVQLTKVQTLICGEIGAAESSRMDALNQFMQGVGFEFQLSDDIVRDMWVKWVMLATLGGITCLFRGSIGEVNAGPAGRELSLKMLAEAAAISTANGYPPTEQSLGWARSVVSSTGSNMTASMYRDLVAGVAVEADQIIGDLLERGRKHGVEATLFQAAYVNLSVYQSRLSRNTKSL
jgi:2-dehydropantoate 2-reductase